MAEGPTVSEGAPGDMERAPEPGWGLGEPRKPAGEYHRDGFLRGAGVGCGHAF